MAKFNKLDVPRQWKDEFTKYPHGYTIFEALCNWTKQVDNMVDNVNDWNDYLDKFVLNFDVELQEEVQSTIERWQNEGLLDDIIESTLNTELDNVKTQLAEKADRTQTEINLSFKRDKSTKLQLEDMSETVLQAIEGGEETTFNLLSIPQSGSVTRDKYDKAIYSPNLFDKTKVEYEKNLSASGGHTVDLSTRNVSGFTEVLPNKDYVMSRVETYVFYDEDETYISGVALGQLTNNYQVTSPENAKYIRFSFARVDNVDEIMVIEGDEPPIKYEPYYFKLVDLKVDTDNLDNDVKNKLSDIDKIYNEFKYTSNLFDVNRISELKYIDNTTGELTTSSTRNTSDYIKVVPGKDYTISSVRGYALYNGDKEFISATVLPNIEYGYTLTAPYNVEYIRFDYYRNDGVQQYVVEGNELKHETFGFTLPNLIIEGEDNTKEGRKNVEIDWQSLTFVNGDLWAFRASDVVQSGIRELYILDGKTLELKKTLLHNFGHVNTVDYNEETDCIIFGNGSGQYGTDGEIYIIEGVKHWANLPPYTNLDIASTIEGSTIIKIDVLRKFGDKINVCWGEDNNGMNNICYVLSNDNKDVRRVLLGRLDNAFDGTYTVLNHYSMSESIDVNQDTCYYNGYLYCSMGHDGLLMLRFELNDDGTITTEKKQEKFYDETGQEITCASEGVAIKNGMIYHGIMGGIKALYKYRPF